jgi:hypothetical protein
MMFYQAIAYIAVNKNTAANVAIDSIIVLALPRWYGLLMGLFPINNT